MCETMRKCGFLADNIKSHVRAMEGALAKVHVTISINPTQELNNEFLSFILKDFIEKEQTLKRLTIREIQECVAKKYGIDLNNMLGLHFFLASDTVNF